MLDRCAPDEPQEYQYGKEPHIENQGQNELQYHLHDSFL